MIPRLLGNACRAEFVNGFLKHLKLIDVYVRIGGSGRSRRLLGIVQRREQILAGVQIVGMHGTEHVLAIIDLVDQLGFRHGDITGVF